MYLALASACVVAWAVIADSGAVSSTAVAAALAFTAGFGPVIVACAMAAAQGRGGWLPGKQSAVEPKGLEKVTDRGWLGWISLWYR